MTTEHLRFSPDILRRLGEELIPHVDQGIVELVRNSYDADAHHCCVELIKTDQPGGALRVTDDGNGMKAESVRDGWLVLGRSSKAARQRTKLGRLPVGDKGLGRLAALRMGRVARLRTRPADEPGREYRLKLNWDLFDTADVVENVALDIKSAPTRRQKGTTIVVTDLRVKLGRREVQRLARALLLLADPFDHSLGFNPKLIAPEFQDLERRVRESYFDDAEFRLVAQLDERGFASAKVIDRSSTVRWIAKHEDLSEGPKKTSPPYGTSPATFELWAFNLASQSFASRATMTELREWLNAVGGVHLYHRGLRVYPYGDPGHDWLDMNLARARSPELRPSTNISVGRMVVPDPREELVQKTDRSGFIEDEAFTELRRFAQDALDWMARERLRERENRRVKERAEAPRAVSAARASLDKTLDQLPPQARPAVDRVVQRLEAAREQEAKTLREDLQLYRTLGTVGTTAAVFAHESAKPVTQIEKMGKRVEDRARKLLGDRFAEIEKPLQYILRAAQALRSFAELPLRLLNREKRRTGRIEVHAVISDLLDLFQPFLTDAQIQTRVELADATPRVRGSVAAIEAILANLLTNAVNALSSETASPTREIVIRTEISGENRLLLRVLDSGSGIVGIRTEDIWLPGRTTRPGGTGLGLTIVRDTVTDLGGKVHALAQGELGGAEFFIELPLVGEE
jgi:signal transduction histidine kinase